MVLLIAELIILGVKYVPGTEQTYIYTTNGSNKTFEAYGIIIDPKTNQAITYMSQKETIRPYSPQTVLTAGRLSPGEYKARVVLRSDNETVITEYSFRI